MRKHPAALTAAAAALLVFFAVTFAYPLSRMLAQITPEGAAVFSSTVFRRAVGSSCLSGALTVLFALPLAMLMALLTESTRVRCRALWRGIFVLPMLLPSVSQGTGLVLLLGTNGLLTRGLRLPGSIYGLQGIVLGQVLYTAPIAYLLLANLLRYRSRSPYDAARLAGVPPLFRWSGITLPFLRKELLAAAFLVFSLSVTGSGMIVYGAYLSKDEDVVGVAQHTALFDTIAAVVAALVIIPACFSYGLDVGAGPSLLFVTLPTILQDIPMGRLFAIILYLAMIFAGVSSLQNMFEAVAESLLHKFPKLSRTAVLAILCVLCLGIGIFMEPISKWGPWMDLVSIYIIPIGATLGAISWFYVMKKDELLAAVNTGSKKERGALWYNVGRFVYVPLAVILCCVALFMHVAF